jgi:hypothetical protein
MKKLLLLLGVAALFAAAPASAQYIYLDVNGDGVCDLSDVLGSSIDHIDVYLDSNHDKDGNLVPCSSGGDLDFFSYSIVLRASGGGTVTFGTWTDNTGFTIVFPAPDHAGSDFWVGQASSAGALPVSGNPYTIGSVAVTVTGTPVVGFAETSAGNPNAFTVFGSNCLTPDIGDVTWVWNSTYWPFDGACGTAPTTDTHPTTWGEIKNLYK